MATTPGTFKARFPEFEKVKDVRIQIFLDDTVGFMGSSENSGRWCGNYEVAQCYLAAHLLTLATFSASGDTSVKGPLKKRQVDEVVIEFAIDPVKVNENEFGSTAYGKRYLSYRRICFAGTIIGV